MPHAQPGVAALFDILLIAQQAKAQEIPEPLLGGLGLWFVFFVTIRDSADPEYSGSSVFGVGTVLVLGLGLILSGLIFMLIWRIKAPAFFRGETLRRDTPTLIIPE